MIEQNAERLAARAMEAGAYEEAVRLLSPLAERNSEYALLTLGWIYETGATGPPDKDAARSNYEHAVSEGSATAHLYLGWLLLRDGQETEARKAFECGAQLNNDECKSVLARLTDNADEKLAGKAIKEGAYEKAVHLLRPLAERNSEYALLTLGWVCETGATGTRDKEGARTYYERAASQGSAAAHLSLGRLFSGDGEETQAREAYQAGADQGDIACMSELGRMMVEGLGGPSDPAEGWAWLERAAAQGQIFAQRTLLAIEDDNAKSASEKLSVKIKIAKLAIRGAKEFLKDPNSDTLR